MVWTETVREFLNNYFLFFVVVLGTVVFFLTKSIMQKLREKRVRVVFKDEEPEKKQSSTFEELFHLDKTTSLEKKDISKEIQSVSALILQDGEEVDKGFFSEIEILKKQLDEVKSKKEAVRGYGLELAKLYEKYHQREIYLEAIVKGMEQAVRGDKLKEHSPLQ